MDTVSDDGTPPKEEALVSQSAASSQDVLSNDAQNQHKLEKRVLRKVDLHLIIPLWLLFVIGFIDRINLGNTAVLGMRKDLHLKGNEFNMALQAFFITYIVFDIPTNLALKQCRPSHLISGLSLCWGISALSQGLVKNFAGLVACRLLIGVFEAGFMPASVYLMGAYYKRHEFQFRFNIMWTGGVVAGAMGGLLAYAFNNMHGVAGLEGWRWVLIFEGIIACLLAVLSLFMLADWPHQANFLSISEKSFLIQRSRSEPSGTATMDHLNKAAVLRILGDWKIWCASMMYLGCGTSGYASAMFIPSILTTMGYTGVQAQVQSIPVWAVAATCSLTAGYLSDKLKHRYSLIMFGLSVAIVGYVILICQGPEPVVGKADSGVPPGARYMALFFVTAGTQITMPISLVWVSNNLSGTYKRGIGSAIQILFGSIAGIVASNSFDTTDAPRYFAGYGITVGMLVVCGVFSSILACGMAVENTKRQRGERDYRLDCADKDNLGDDDPSFRFTL